MVRKFGLGMLLISVALSGTAQDSPAQAVSESEVPRAAYHYVGIQANQLIRQLLSLGTGSSVVDNPYLVNYSVNSTANGAGINLSLGWTYNQINDGDGTFQRETKINDFFFRVGFDKKSSLGKRWLLSSGIDLVFDNRKNSTKTTSVFAPSTTIDNKTGAFGLGPRVSLNYAVSDKILLGTEANYYFKWLKTTTDNITEFGATETETTKFKRFQLNVPAVLYLIVKL